MPNDAEFFRPKNVSAVKKSDDEASEGDRNNWSWNWKILPPILGKSDITRANPPLFHSNVKHNHNEIIKKQKRNEKKLRKKPESPPRASWFMSSTPLPLKEPKPKKFKKKSKNKEEKPKKKKKKKKKKKLVTFSNNTNDGATGNDITPRLKRLAKLRSNFNRGSVSKSKKVPSEK